MYQAAHGTFAPPAPHTPLGEPITSAAAAQFHGSDRLTWHLSYWLNIEVIGRSLGEDPVLMAARIDREGRLMADAAFRTTLQNAWYAFQDAHRAHYMQHWARSSLADAHSKAYPCDLARMLTRKRRKMHAYQHQLAADRDRACHEGNQSKELSTASLMARIEDALQREESRDAEARIQLAQEWAVCHQLEMLSGGDLETESVGWRR